MTKEELKLHIKSYKVYPEIFDKFLNLEFPLSKTFGEDISKTEDGIEYKTEGFYSHGDKKGKRHISFNVETFGTKHWYGTFNISLWYVGRYEGRTYMRSIHMDEDKMPDEIKCLTGGLKLCHSVTQEEIDDDPDRWFGYNTGTLTEAFNSERDLFDCAKNVFETIFNKKEWILVNNNGEPVKL